MNDTTQEHSDESNLKISGSDKYGEKGSLSRHRIVSSLSAGLLSYI